MFRETRIILQTGDDAGTLARLLDQTLDQALDLKQALAQVSVNPSDTEFAIATNISNVYNCTIASSYPILVRFNGDSATQFQLTSNSVAEQNIGSTPVYTCVAVLPFKITSLKLAPIAGATQVAQVKIIMTGDPAVAYT